MDIVAGYAVDLEKIDQVIVSEVEKEVFDFCWRIKKFPENFLNDLISPVFTSPITKTEWNVNIRNDVRSRIYIGLRLSKAQTPFPIAASYSFSFLNSEMEVHAGPYDYNYNFTSEEHVNETSLTNATNFMDVTQGFLAQDRSINLFFRVTTSTAQQKEEYGNFKESCLNWATVGQESLKSFLDNDEFADMTLSTKKNSFRASKVILAAQSPVFKAMFLSEMLESKENVVKIEDFSDETVKGFLEFLYTGESESLKEDAVELLKISDKYEVLPLKKECEKILMKELNKENAADLLILAHFYNASSLSAKLVCFVKKCGKEVADTESFKQLKKLHPEIFLDLYTKLV